MLQLVAPRRTDEGNVRGDGINTSILDGLPAGETSLGSNLLELLNRDLVSPVGFGRLLDFTLSSDARVSKDSRLNHGVQVVFERGRRREETEERSDLDSDGDDDDDDGDGELISYDAMGDGVVVVV